MEVMARQFVARAIPGALKMALKFKGVSYRQLALKAGVSKSTIGNIASGSVAYCNPENASAIARGLSMSAEDLFVLSMLDDPGTGNRWAA